MNDENKKISLWKRICDIGRSGTLFLERNQIWFKTILSVMATVATICVSCASNQIAQYQATLTAQTVSANDSEKQPFFDVVHDYDKERGQYIYRIVNNGGEIRRLNVTITPWIEIEREERIIDDTSGVAVSRHEKRTSVIDVPGFLSYEYTESEKEVLAFCDLRLEDVNTQYIKCYKDYSFSGLADTYFRDIASWYNSVEDGKWFNACINYYVQIECVNYKNEEVLEEFCLIRVSDITGETEGNTRLRITDSGADYEQKKSNWIIVNSLDLSVDETLGACERIIDDFVKNVSKTED